MANEKELQRKTNQLDSNFKEMEALKVQLQENIDQQTDLKYKNGNLSRNIQINKKNFDEIRDNLISENNKVLTEKNKQIDELLVDKAERAKRLEQLLERDKSLLNQMTTE